MHLLTFVRVFSSDSFSWCLPEEGEDDEDGEETDEFWEEEQEQERGGKRRVKWRRNRGANFKFGANLS